MGQHLANVTGRAVRLSYSTQGTANVQGVYVRLLQTDPQGRHLAWELSRPEPGTPCWTGWRARPCWRPVSPRCRPRRGP
ncbi:hypothetical protein NKH77_28885 [Streptomyces sp. M19]